MAFNSADTAAFKNVWVFCEQRQGVMMPTTFELISEGRKLANELGVELCGILLGDNVDGIAAELGEYGADKVYVYNSPLLKDFTTDAYTKVIVEAVEELKPEVLLFGASNIGRDLAPRCAARLHTGLCADCTHLDIDMPNYKGFLKEASTLPEERIEKLGTVMINREPHDVSRDLKMTRPAFGGHLMASIICPRFRPAMATVRPGVMKKRECPKNVEIIEPKFELTAADIHTEVVDTVKAAKKLVDLIGADFIVSVGRGISKDVEGGITSRMAASQPGRCSRRGRAASALSASTASSPARRRFSAIISRMLASSSTTRTLTIYRSSVSIRSALCAGPGMLRKIIFIQSAQTHPACQWLSPWEQRRRPPPVAETGRNCWGSGQQDASESEADAGSRNPTLARSA